MLLWLVDSLVTGKYTKYTPLQLRDVIILFPFYQSNRPCSDKSVSVTHKIIVYIIILFIRNLKSCILNIWYRASCNHIIHCDTNTDSPYLMYTLINTQTYTPIIASIWNISWILCFIVLTYPWHTNIPTLWIHK